MSEKKLQIEVLSAWNTYASSMMSVLEHCGLWRKNDTFQKFMSVTGIASVFCVDEACSALPITDYDWMDEHPCFLNRIGIESKRYNALPNDPDYKKQQKEAVQAVKQAIDKNHAAVAWGIDTGEFGIIYGYDDEDQVFYVKGIGNPNTNSSMPILYTNLGKTFEPAPVLYCEIPEIAHEVDWNHAYINTLQTYVDEMNRICDHSDRAYGIAVYDMVTKAVQEDKLDSYGFRYCTGIYYERKDALLQYFLEIQKEKPDRLLGQLIESFQSLVGLYKKLMFDILQQDTNGWNYLYQPVNKECYNDIVKIMYEMKVNEKHNMELITKMISAK